MRRKCVETIDLKGGVSSGAVMREGPGEEDGGGGIMGPGGVRLAPRSAAMAER